MTFQTALIDIKQYSDVKLKKFLGRLRILIALYQILNALGPIYGVRYPAGYTNVRCPPSSPPQSVSRTMPSPPRRSPASTGTARWTRYRHTHLFHPPHRNSL